MAEGGGARVFGGKAVLMIGARKELGNVRLLNLKGQYMHG